MGEQLVGSPNPRAATHESASQKLPSLPAFHSEAPINEETGRAEAVWPFFKLSAIPFTNIRVHKVKEM